MKSTIRIIAMILTLIGNSSIYAQRIGFDEIDESKVSTWIAVSNSEYQNVYHFGDSEMESTFILLFSEGKYYAQISRFIMQNSTDAEWTKHFITLKNVRIVGNKFYSDITNGEFVTYDYGNRKENGLKVYKPWSGWESGIYEIGLIAGYPPANYFSGKYTQASYRLLKNDELINMSKYELRLMRNEIFARYGYKFTPGSEMYNYFNQQDWYSAKYDNVNDFLTDIEKENINLIKQAEK
jgi:hypothetical protein